MSKNKNKNKHAVVEVPANDAGEPAPFEAAGEVNEDGSPAGSAFDGEELNAEAPESAEGSQSVKTGLDGDAETIVSEAGKLAAPSVNNGGGAAGDDADAKAKANAEARANAPRPMTRREEITARIAEIERDGGPQARTHRVNDQMKQQRADRDRKVAEWDREISDMQEQVRALERVQQRELEEVRLLKIELAKMAD